MLIGLCGYPGSGKSEVTYILMEHGFIPVDTKVKIRQLASVLTGKPETDFQTQEGKSSLYKGVSHRKIMGEVGNAIETLFGEDYTLNETLSYYRNLYPEAPLVVDSLRKDQTRNFPGLVYQVVSNRAQEPKDDFDRFYQGRTNGIIVNDGTHLDLQKTVKRVFSL